MERGNAIKVLIMLAATALIMCLSGILIYNFVAVPRFYDKFMSQGKEYADKEQYKEASDNFEKAVKIKPTSADARLNAAKACIENRRVDEAAQHLRKAQKHDFDNMSLLKEMVEISNEADPDTAYELIMNYVNKYGRGSLTNELSDMLDSADAEPQIAEFEPPSGTYIKPFKMKLKSEKTMLGHAYYYTESDSNPTDSDTRYRGGIPIDKNTHLKFRGYNRHGESTEVFEAEYEIKPVVEQNLNNLIAKATDAMNSTQEGTAIGNCEAGAKEPLGKAIDETNTFMEKRVISLDEANEQYEALALALSNFNSRIFEETDKTKLMETLDEAQEALDSIDNGTSDGVYREEDVTALREAVERIRGMLDDKLLKQYQVDDFNEELMTLLKRLYDNETPTLESILIGAGAQTGPVTVSLFWNTRDDLDLHVENPYGETIYYAHKRDSYGGNLDVDRQVSSFVENPVENIYWDNPPSGTYKVSVNVYTKRSSGDIPLTVRVLINGHEDIYNMTVSSGQNDVCTFVY